MLERFGGGEFLSVSTNVVMVFFDMHETIHAHIQHLILILLAKKQV